MVHPSKTILILTVAGDHHSYAVAEALRKKGARVELWHTSDFPTRMMESVIFDENGTHILANDNNGTSINDQQVDTVWNRRISLVLDGDRFHEADREFAEGESKIFRVSILDALAGNAFWVNPWIASRRTEHKIVQYQYALAAGFDLPNTICTNDPRELKKFMEAHHGQVVYKAFRARPWSDGENGWMLFTTRLSHETMPDDDVIQHTPGMYQELIEKDYELRVTIIGQKVFSAKLLSQETQNGKLDWKRSYKELEIQQHQLSPELTQKCFDFMKNMGLVFGCFDFIVTPEGRHVFLEVNQMGQFLFVEMRGGFPLLDAFSEFLLQGRPDFDWDPQKANIFYTDEMANDILSHAENMKQIHTPDPPWTWQE